MKMLYTAVGIFKLKNQGKNNVYPTVILSGKECRLDVQEMMIWSALNWRITDDKQLHTYYSEQKKKSGVVFSRSYTDTLNRLIVRGLVASGRGENGEEALYDLISGLYIIPLYQSPVIRIISFLRMVFIFKLPYEKAKVLFERDKKNKNERRVMKLAFSAPMSTAEIVKCIDKNIDFILIIRYMVAKTANRYTHPIITELFFPLPHFSVARYIASNTSNRKKNWNTVCTTASANPIFPLL